MSKGRYSIKMLLATIVAGLLYAVAAEFVIRKVENLIPGMVLVPVYFIGLFLVLGAVVLLTGKMIYSRSSGTINKKQWFIALLLIIVLSVFFEFIYEIIKERDKTREISSYLFIIDDSGSMLSNDPDGIRYQVIDELLADKPSDFRYGIYSFNNDIVCLREMAPKSDVQMITYPEVTGGTRIKGVLEEVGDAVKQGTIALDEGTRVILLSDGYATDLTFLNNNAVLGALRDFSKKGITVSTVGLSDADDNLMSLIADKTGGVYVKVDDASQLNDAMSQAAVKQRDSRNLLGYRTTAPSLDILLGILRVLFIALLGVVIAGEKTVLCERFLDTSAVLVSSAIGSVLAGICIEIGMNTLGIHPAIMRLITCALIAFTLLRNDMGIRDNSGANVR